MTRKIITNILFYSGIPWLIRTLFLRNRITIIYYHSISPERFEKHIHFLKKWFNLIALESYVKSPEKSPNWALIITIDDGHKSNFDLLDIIKKHNIPVTIFLTTDIVGKNRRFWFKNTEPTKKEILKIVSDEERVRILKDSGFIEGEEAIEGEGLTFDQIEKMKSHVDFQSHTATHPILPNCTEEKVIFELKKSKEDVENLTGKSCYALAFPIGDYTKREIEIAKETGYQCTLGCGQKPNNKNTDLFELQRISASDNSSTKELALRLTSIWAFLKRQSQ